ncbi:UAA transporter family protein [Ostertagia ostertagi]
MTAKYDHIDDPTGKSKADSQHINVLTRSHLVEAFHFLICAGGILLCYFYFGIQQERIVQGKYENGEKFTYTQALVFFLCVANTIFAWVLRPKRDVDTVPTKINQALQYLPYPTQVLAKSCKPIPVLIFGVLFAGKRYSWRKYVFIIMIVVGVAMFLYKDKKSSTEKQIGIGEVLLLLSLTMDGTTTSIQDRINISYKRSTLSMMFFMNFFSTIYLMIGLFVTGELFEFIGFVQRHPHVLFELCFVAASSCGGQYFIFKTISEFSPLTCSVITTTRKLFTIIISVVFMNHPLLERQKWATFIVFSGLIMDAVDSKFSKKRPHPK